MSRFSQQVVQDLLDHLDALDVIELIDYHPESIQRVGDSIKCWCPFSRDHSGRYLTVNIAQKTFESAPPGGFVRTGNLIDLFAGVRQISFEAAMQELADEFGVMLVEATGGADVVEALLAEGERNLPLARDTKGKRNTEFEEAEKRFRRALEIEKGNIRALRGLFALRLLERNPLTLLPAATALMDAELAAGNHEALIDAANRHLEASPADLGIRQRLAEALVALGRTQEAIGELMALADAAEQNGQFDTALGAYRRVQGLGDDSIDVHPMIVSLLTARGRRKDALAEIQKRVDELKGAGRFAEASRMAASKLEIAPEDHDIRLQTVELAIMAGLPEDTLDQCLKLVDEMLTEGHDEKAAEALSYLASERPENAMILELLVTAYKRLEQPELAGELQYRLVELYLKEDNPSSALLILEELLLGNENDLRALESLAELHEREGDRKAAAAMLRRMVDVHVAAGDKAEALPLANRAIALDAGLSELRELRIDLLFATGARDEALSEVRALAGELAAAKEDARLADMLEFAQAQAPQDLWTIQALSGAYERLGDAKKSEELRVRLVEGLRASGQLREAERALLELVRADPANARLVELLGDIFVELGDKRKGRQAFLDAAKLYREAKRPQECRVVLEKLTAADPGDADALAELEALCKQLGDKAGLLTVARRQAARELEAKNWDGAIAAAEKILAAEKDDEQALQMAIAAHRGAGRSEKALHSCELLATVYRGQKSISKEAAVLREIVAEAPKLGGALERLVRLEMELGHEDQMLALVDKFQKENAGQAERTIKLLRELINFSPKHEQLHRRLADLFRKLGRLDEMIAEQQKLVEICEGAGRHDEAIEILEDALTAAPDSASTRQALVKLLKAAKRTEHAVSHALVLAAQFRKGGKHKEALAVFEDAGRLDPGNEDIIRGHAATLRDGGDAPSAMRKLRDLADVFAARGKVEKAIAVLHELIEEDPRNVETRRAAIELKRTSGRAEDAQKELLALADLHQQQGEEEEAVGARREAIALAPAAPDARLSLIRSLVDAGRDSEANIEQVELANVFIDGKKYERALEILDALVAESPSNVSARGARARCYDEMGDEKRALAEYRELRKYADRASSSMVPLPAASPVAPGATSPKPEEYAPEGMEIFPENDFESYVVGTKNNFAYATAKAVAEHPGTARNPLFLYSFVGLGKTHLLHAIANHLKKKKPDIKIVYTSTEYFTSELIDAIQNNRVTEFRNRHRAADLLLLDDVQFLAGKERAQEEFFHLFNMLYQARRQIVVTSDRPPKDIAHLDLRLRTRFGQGVIVDIQPPDFETRVAILRAEAKRRKITVPDDVMSTLAEKIVTNVRELKGAFNQLLTQHEIGGDPLTTAVAMEMLEKYFVAGP